MVMIVGSNIANALAYIYHIIFGRVLGPSLYGELSVIISVMGLLLASLSFVGLVVVKFVSSSKASEHRAIYNWFIKRSLILGGVFALFILVTSPFIANFLHLDVSIVALLAVIVPLTVVSMVYRAFLQGLMKFFQFVTVGVVEMSGRIIIGLVLVFVGFSVFGAVLGIFLAMAISLILLMYFLREFKGNDTKIEFSKGKQVVAYAIPIFITSFATNSMFSTDLVLVKHFFSSHDAGLYASLSTLGRIIFYGVGPVSTVMFPIVSKRQAEGKGYKRIFLLSLLMAVGIASWVLFIFYFFPDLSIRLLFGSKYLNAAPLLGSFGVFMSVYTISYLILNFFLSLGKTRVAIFALIASAIQIFGIWIYHGDLQTVIRVSTVASLFLMVSLVLYFFSNYKHLSK